MLRIPQGTRNGKTDVNLQYIEVLRLLECEDSENIFALFNGFSMNILQKNKITKLPYESQLKNIRQCRDGPIKIVYSFLEQERWDSNKRIEKFGVCYMRKGEQLKIKGIFQEQLTDISVILQKQTETIPV